MDDVYGVTMEAACEALLRAHTGWDEPSDLYFAYRHEGIVRLGRTELLLTVALHAKAEGLPPYRPGELLAGIAATCLAWNVREAARGTDMIGIALYNEAIRVAHDDEDVADADQIRAYVRDRKLWTHPRALEYREVYVLETGQPLLVLDLPRGGGQIERVENMTGAVASGMRAIANAVVPDYEERDR